MFLSQSHRSDNNLAGPQEGHALPDERQHPDQPTGAAERDEFGLGWVRCCPEGTPGSALSKHKCCVGRSQHKVKPLASWLLGRGSPSQTVSLNRLRRFLYLTLSWALSLVTFNGINGQEHWLKQIFGCADTPACHIFIGTQIKSLFISSICYKWN